MSPLWVAFSLTQKPPLCSDGYRITKSWNIPGWKGSTGIIRGCSLLSLCPHLLKASSTTRVKLKRCWRAWSTHIPQGTGQALLLTSSCVCPWAGSMPGGRVHGQQRAGLAEEPPNLKELTRMGGSSLWRCPPLCMARGGRGVTPTAPPRGVTGLWDHASTPGAPTSWGHTGGKGGMGAMRCPKPSHGGTATP